MTIPQSRRFYFPAWNRAAAAQGWRMRRGRLDAGRKDRYGEQLHNDLYQRAWDAAESLALRNHRAVTDDDLRHGCHVAAFGRDVSSKDLNNPQTDRIECLFRLMTDPHDLRAVMDWLHPENAQRTRYVRAIEAVAPFAYIDSMCRDMFASIYDPPNWEYLPVEALAYLRRKLAGRQPLVATPASEQAVNADEPY